MADLNLVSINQSNYWDNPDNTTPLIVVDTGTFVSLVTSSYYNPLSIGQPNYWDNPDNVTPLSVTSSSTYLSLVTSAYYNLVSVNQVNFWNNPDNMTPIQLVNYVGAPSTGGAYTVTEGFSFGEW